MDFRNGLQRLPHILPQIQLRAITADRVEISHLLLWCTPHPGFRVLLHQNRRTWPGIWLRYRKFPLSSPLSFISPLSSNLTSIAMVLGLKAMGLATNSHILRPRLASNNAHICHLHPRRLSNLPKKAPIPTSWTHGFSRSRFGDSGRLVAAG